jgi:hypothetical protein
MNKAQNIVWKSLLIILLSVVCCMPSVSAQSLNIPGKKFLIKPLDLSSFQDTIKNKPPVKTFRMRKNPWVAVGLSAVLPGAGQYYNKSYWKIPVIAAFGGYFGYIIVKNNNDFIDFRDRYAASQTAQNPEGDLTLKAQREFYRDERDRFYLYGALLYLINLIDAYVDAHLYDFDVSETVNFGVVKGSRLLDMKVSF